MRNSLGRQPNFHSSERRYNNDYDIRPPRSYRVRLHTCIQRYYLHRGCWSVRLLPSNNYSIAMAARHGIDSPCLWISVWVDDYQYAKFNFDLGTLQDASPSWRFCQWCRNSLYDYRIHIRVLATCTTCWTGFDELRVFSVWRYSSVEHCLVYCVREKGLPRSCCRNRALILIGLIVLRIIYR